ncbi:permease [Myxococcus sp. K15C18031901]|uniref:EamA family transporter n=1 Tax=Myxococcus dinghuensis TaxID=2906761 RepID=UPI0020A7C563|nr:EamA family transporter [Myxococcus dinghuensis]MCP3103621.1 permease [Myxococcus dinghuensis]
METVALVLVLSSAFLHATWNAMLKRHPNPEAGVVAVIAVATVGGALWASGMHGAALSSKGLGWAVFAGACESVYLAALSRALHRAPLGLVYTVSRGGAMLLVWPVSVLALAEGVSGWTASGAVVLGVGLGVMQLARPAGRVASGLAWAALSAVAIAGYHLSYKLALAQGALPPVLFTVGMFVALPVLVVERGRRMGWRTLQREAWSRPVSVLVAGVLCMLSFALMLSALGTSGAGVVLTLRNTSIAFALGLAALQGERLGRRQLAGAGLVCVGAMLLGLPG